MVTIAQNLEQIEARITAVCELAGRAREDVRLLPVSKTKPPQSVVEAYRAGYRRFGENKVQEAHDKWELLRQDYPDLEWVIIGHLQTNKAKLVAEFATEFQALDNLGQAEQLQRRLEQYDRTLDVLVQINSSEESQKFGIAPADALNFTAALRHFDRLKVKGLMTLALFSADKQAVGACFDRMVAVQQQLLERDGAGWQELSMGMSGDFELAIAKGATTVRVGQSIFGDRLDPNQFWPGIKGIAGV